MRETLREFNQRTDHEAWNGTSSAFRAGSRARAFGGEMRYGRADFQDAWRRGFDAMDAFLSDGHEIIDRPRRRLRHVYGGTRFGPWSLNTGDLSVIGSSLLEALWPHARIGEEPLDTLNRLIGTARPAQKG